MMYVSSACVKHERIKDSIEELARQGFMNIELSGGTAYYDGYKKDLLRLKEEYNLSYLVHNYFPPPRQDFILNLASPNEYIYQQTLAHYKKAIALSQELGASRFGFHAGFLVDFSTGQAGGEISYSKLNDRKKALKRFCEGFNILKKEADHIELYVENNVLSLSNARTFKGQNPFLLTDSAGYEELKRLIDFKLLLDAAHLRVSARTLGLDFGKQLDSLISVSDYIHLSDNDGVHDQNKCFTETSQFLSVLKNYDFTNKIVTSETYGASEDIKVSQAVISKSLGLIDVLELKP